MHRRLPVRTEAEADIEKRILGVRIELTVLSTQARMQPFVVRHVDLSKKQPLEVLDALLFIKLTSHLRRSFSEDLEEATRHQENIGASAFRALRHSQAEFNSVRNLERLVALLRHPSTKPQRRKRTHTSKAHANGECLHVGKLSGTVCFQFGPVRHI